MSYCHQRLAGERLSVRFEHFLELLQQVLYARGALVRGLYFVTFPPPFFIDNLAFFDDQIRHKLNNLTASHAGAYFIVYVTATFFMKVYYQL